MDEKLKDKAVTGVKWTSINTLFTSISAPIYQIILALLLKPEEFAYIAVISLLIGLSTLISDIGVSEAIIQKDDVNNNQLSSLLYFNALVGIFIAVILIGLSGIIENYYGMLDLRIIIYIISISIIFNALSSIFRIYLQKMLLFSSFSILQIIKTFLDIGVSVILISIGLGIYGYLYGTVFSILVNLILLIIVSLKKTDLKIKFHFNLNDIKPFLNFGISISLKKVLTFLTQRIDEVIIGGSLSSEVLGVYYFGKRLILQLQAVVTKSFAQVLLPVFSLIKNDVESLRNAYNKVTYFAGMIGIPLFVGLSLVSHNLVPSIFGEKWSESILVIQVLSIVMIFQILTANIATSLLYSRSKQNIVLLIDIIINTIYLIALLLFSRFGIFTTIMLYSAYTIIKAVILQKFVSIELKYSLIKYVLQLKSILISTFIMALSIFIIENIFVNKINQFILLIVTILLAIVVYIIMESIIDKKNVKQLISLVRKRGK